MLTNHLPDAAQPTLRCPGCKHANPAHSNFCNICGRGLPSVPCPQCGEMNDLAMTTMCTRCGGPLTDRADSEAAKDARLRVIEAAMGGGFPPVVAAGFADTPASPASVDVQVDVDLAAELSPLPAAAALEPAPDARPAAPPMPSVIPTLTAAIAAPGVPSASSPEPTAPRASAGPAAPSLARMPRSSEAPAFAANQSSAAGPAQPSPTLADFGPSAFNLPHLNTGHSANSAPFVVNGWRTEEPQRADFDMRQITELVRTSLAAETVPMLPALSSGGAAARSEPEPPPGRVAPRPRRLVMAGGVAAGVVVAVLAYRVYGPARVPELTPVPLAGGGAGATTATAPVDGKAARMQASLDRAAELLARRPTGAGVSGDAGEPAGDVGNAARTPLPSGATTAPATAGVDAAAVVGAAPATSTAQPPIAVILPTTLAPTPSTNTRQEAPRTSRPTPSREPAISVAAARSAKSPAATDTNARAHTPPSTYKAQPAPPAGPCTEGVAALGLCDAVTPPANPRR